MPALTWYGWLIAILGGWSVLSMLAALVMARVFGAERDGEEPAGALPGGLSS